MDYRIKAVAAMLGVSDTSVRAYEADIGLEPRRQENGPRTKIYSEADVFRLAAHRTSRSTPAALPWAGAPLVVSVYLPKGGVAKSTLSTELAIQFALMGLKVLLVDLDPQASSTVIMGYEPEAEEAEIARFNLTEDQLIRYNFANVLNFNELNGGMGFQQVPLSMVLKKPYGEYGPHLIPADVKLSSIGWGLMNAANRDHKIANWIKSGINSPSAMNDLRQYQIIIFDNSPASTALSRCSLVASDYCVAPVRLDALSAKSLSFVSKELQTLNENNLPCPGLIAVPTFHQANTTRSMQIIKGLESIYMNIMTEKVLRQAEIFPRSLLQSTPAERMPVSLSHPMHPVVREDLFGIANNIIARARTDMGEPQKADGRVAA